MIDHSRNATTTLVGQATATVIEDTMSPSGVRLTTLELVYPRYIHSELMTHRMFSRNASSSRATPLQVNLDEVCLDPVFFDFVGKNQKGMVATEPLNDVLVDDFKTDWESLGIMVASHVAKMNKKYGIHKQTLNRALEPWLRIRTLVTATEWENFFKLRLSPNAQPEIQSLARAMHEAMGKSEPKGGVFHVPYLKFHEQKELKVVDAYKVSAARCARVSYARHDGRETTTEEDLKLARNLFDAGHMSPFEHAAMWGLDSDPYEFHYNLRGWQSVRYQAENDLLPKEWW